MNKIQKIKIEDCRGIRYLELEIKGKNLLVLGENGTGKSSLIDGIEFLFSGHMKRFSGIQELSFNRHAHNVNGSANNMSVEIFFDDGNSVKRTKNDVSDIPNNIKSLFGKANNILRRNEILEFIESQAANRYSSLAKLLGIDNFEDTQKALIKNQERLQSKLDNQKEQVSTYQESISQILEEEKYVEEKILAKINEYLLESKLEKIEKKEELEQRIKGISTYDTDPKIKISRLQIIVENLLFTQDFIGKLQKIEDKKITEQHKIAQIKSDFLQKGIKIINQEVSDICPFCQQKFEIETTKQQARERIQNHKELSNNANEIEKIVEKLLDTIEDKKNKFPKQLLAEFDINTEDLEKEFKHLEYISKHINQVKKLEVNFNSKTIENIQSINQEIKNTRSKIDEKVQTIQKDFLFTLTQCSTQITNLNITKKEKLRLEKQLEINRQIREAFDESKKEIVSNMLKTIEEKFNELYDKIHPEEGHEDLELYLEPERRSSISLKTGMMGIENEDPRALSSEGHLDTMGLCIFLAAVDVFEKNNQIVILDDVLTTVDSNHRKRIAKLLNEDFSERQLIITTHDSFWFDRFIQIQIAQNTQHEYENKEIVNWTPEFGPEFRSVSDHWKDVQTLLEEGKKDLAGNKARKYAEHISRLICKELQAQLPFTEDGKYNPGVLWICARKRIEEKIKRSEWKKQMLELFTEADEEIPIGNELSHENIRMGTYTSTEIKDFADKIHEIYKHFFCECGGKLKYIRETSTLQCTRKSCSNKLVIKTS